MINKTKTFPLGGVHPPDNKLSADQAIKELPLPKTVSIPVSQHIGAPASPIVKVGDEVKTGQLIAAGQGFISANIHSSVTGKVTKIDDIMDHTGYKRQAIVIEAAEDVWMDDVDTSSEIKSEISLSPEDIINKTHESGIVGLGGAMFPSCVKLKIPEGKKAEFLLINGVECEPYLTSDHRLMLEKGEEILIGTKIMLKALNIDKAMIGIEDNKSDAIQHLTDLANKYSGIEIFPLKVQYPQGGERQLVKALTNREIAPPPKGLPIDAGCVVFNVATTFAVYEAIQKNKPLIERTVTVTGKKIPNPANFKARIGTSLTELIEAAGGLPENTGKVINGGPMMGKALASVDIPLVKGISGIITVSDEEAKRKEVIDCVRCGKCVFVCPLGLEPYLVARLAEKGNYDQAELEKITNCCECACCSYICPSNRPLLDYIRLGKTTVLQKMRERGKK